MHWIDIVFIAIIIIFALVGVYKGLFESILGLISSGVSILLAIWACKPVAGFLNSIADVDGFFTKLFISWGMPDKITFLNVELTAEKVGVLCTIVISILAVWLLIKLAIKLLEKLFDDIASSSTAMSGLNRLFGLVFGAAKGLLVVFAFLGLIGIIGKVEIVGEPINNLLNQTTITRKVSNYVNEWVDKNLKDKLLEIVDSLTKEPEKPETPPVEENTNTPEKPEGEEEKQVVVNNLGINKNLRITFSLDNAANLAYANAKIA